MTTFGPVGRVVMTVLLLLPIKLLLSAGVFGLVGLVLWLFVFLPMALRDVWRPAALPETDLTRLEAETRRRREWEERSANRVDPPPFEPPTRW